MIRKLDPVERANLTLLTIRLQRTIRGSQEHGRCPYIEYEGVRYSNDVLRNMYGLVGRKLVIFVNREDLRRVKAFFDNGEELGDLIARGGWVLRPHDLATRKAINHLRIRKLIHFLETDDPVEAYYAYLAEQAPKSRKARTQIARIQKQSESAPPLPAASQVARSKARSASITPPPMKKGVLKTLRIKTVY